MSYTIKISQDDNDRRLDRILRGLFKHVTLGEIMKSIRKGEVRINSKRVKEPGTKIFAGDELVVKWSLEDKENENKIFTHNSWGKIRILFHGENVLILNKPAYMEIVLTGRNAHEKIIEIADLVSKIEPVKHYWDKGVVAREGIEY